jgi:hypothetical protein
MTDIATAIQSLNKKGGNTMSLLLEVNQLKKQNTTVMLILFQVVMLMVLLSSLIRSHIHGQK